MTKRYMLKLGHTLRPRLLGATMTPVSEETKLDVAEGSIASLDPPWSPVCTA